jgi:hypothetical protein
LLETLQSSLGEAIVVGAALAILVGLIIWARDPQHGERPLILGVAAAFTLAAVAIYWLAITVGWWRGAYFQISPLVQSAILISASLVAWTVWLNGYRWLTERTNQALQIYIAVSVLLILAVAIAHRLNLGRGLVLVGPDLTIVVDAVAVVIVLWIPVMVYEAVRRTLERADELP